MTFYLQIINLIRMVSEYLMNPSKRKLVVLMDCDAQMVNMAVRLFIHGTPTITNDQRAFLFDELFRVEGREIKVEFLYGKSDYTMLFYPELAIVVFFDTSHRPSIQIQMDWHKFNLKVVEADLPVLKILPILSHSMAMGLYMEDATYEDIMNILQATSAKEKGRD